ncbi:L-lysine 6-transaminase [Hoyosella rhizosphaerae]|uniref:L-lysine-epsilon aminotransferase n=1 Tax=Hoyosella rhizosphaerae TaxID=1755582 RepID=A0A916U895_9ACTN|nr:L-lysine 6-transaminase [Hoyosella rhizosphaerae]MBN4927501.1 L-lysine 6-transaminase [Hoyosella rhizosphaerae]GGC63978.1 L-lysine 6-transaminase [Hoyosella rhizosphaerae]
MVAPNQVHNILSQSILADGFDIVLDLVRSHGSWIVDARDQSAYLDMFSFFASSALGMNHPALVDDVSFRAELLEAAINKPSNSDMYSMPFAEFVATFRRILGDPELPHLFFIDGGANAVENALKVAFDWKSRHNESLGISPALGGRVLHLTDAFHGRSGYTLSLTNTEPIKTARFPQFNWPRIRAPYPGTDRSGHARNMPELEKLSLKQARSAFLERPNDIACFIAEPIQGEGGDHHLSSQFLQAMQELCRENNALFVVDEVQTGCGFTGTRWAYEQLGIAPDVVVFGKKTHICGIMAGRRVDEVEDNVFRVSSRINSTFGGNLADMVRARKILEVIHRDGLIDAAREKGHHLLQLLQRLANKHRVVSDPRGRGLMCAVTLPTREVRDTVIQKMKSDHHVLILGCGERSLRFRPTLTVTEDELNAAVDALDAVLSSDPI